MNLAKMRAQSIRATVPRHRSSVPENILGGEGLMHRRLNPDHHTSHSDEASVRCWDCDWHFDLEQP